MNFNLRHGFNLLLLVLSLTAGCDLFSKMPSDATMRYVFFRNQQGFVKLVKMSNEDQHVTVITPDFTYLDTDASWPRRNIGFPEQRWDDYRNLFRELNIVGGLSHRMDYSPAVFIIAYGTGGVLASSNKGYVYSQKPLSPIVRSLDVMPKELYDSKGHAIAFTSLTQDWYIYREEY